MDTENKFEHCLLIRVGVVAKGNRCLSIMRMLDSVRPGRIRLKLMCLAPIVKSAACYKFAGEMGIQIFDDYRELLYQKSLDLILEMTGDPKILAELVTGKPSSVGILDRQASMLVFDMVNLDERVAEKESEISLATSFASALLEASPDAVLVMDRNYRIINCNDSTLITGGRGRESILGKYCYQVIHGALQPCNSTDRVCPMQIALRTGKPERAMHEIKTPDGDIRLCHVTTYPLFNRLGEIIQVVDVIRDITKDLTTQVEARTQAIKDDLNLIVQEDRLVSLGRLVASVCHEINNPIASIVTFNKLIKSHIEDGTLPPEGLAGFDRYLELSVREAMRCGGIVKNLLTFARQKGIEPREIDLIEMVDTIMQLVGHQLEMADVTYGVALPDPPFRVWGDYAQIQQCLMNLIFNAIESMAGGGHLSIIGGIDNARSRKWITVSDTGCGIAENDLPRIFEPFYSTKLDGKGVGLGLSMVYGIVRQHQGSVEVESEVGNGTVFKINLPAGDDTMTPPES
ncbi:Two-component system sensor histidine kinase [Olavius algarvensis associated proteobacterium Delta 3]|nr:Two-component system sensor histidine kinase [Olavius algarvensis associated proteobacterium Delta 3]CAB5166083.1 Two-component system sensor histidine kinase [Olavius algarvensis associated proteobacterium Delta 3]